MYPTTLFVVRRAMNLMLRYIAIATKLTRTDVPTYTVCARANSRYVYMSRIYTLITTKSELIN